MLTKTNLLTGCSGTNLAAKREMSERLNHFMVKRINIRQVRDDKPYFFIWRELAGVIL